MKTQKTKIITGVIIATTFLFAVSVNAATTIGTNIITAGSLGVGTTTPSAKFAITGSGTGSGKSFVLSNSSDAEQLSLTDSGSLSLSGNIYLNSATHINFSGTYGSPEDIWTLGDVITPTGAGITTGRATLLGVFGGSNQGFMIRNNSNTSLFEVNGDGTKAYLKGNLGIGTSTPSSIFHVTAGTSATTTTEFGDQYSSSSKACYNTKNNTGGAISFYFVGTSMVVENNRCR